MQAFNPNEIYRYTALGRALDPLRYRTNLYIMLLTPLAGVLAGLVTLLNGGDLSAGLRAGFYTSAAFFIAWVMSRDVDPDHNESAFLAAAITLSVAPAALAVVALAYATTMLRVISRIVGPVPSLLDYAGVIVLLGLAAVFDGGLIALAAVAGFVLDGRLSQGTRWSWIGAGISAALALVGFALHPPLLAAPGTLYILLGIGVLLAAGVVFLRSTHFNSACDGPNFTLDARRVRAALAFLMLLALLSMSGGDALMRAYAPVWATLAAVALWRGVVTLRR